MYLFKFETFLSLKACVVMVKETFSKRARLIIVVVIYYTLMNEKTANEH